LEVDRSLKHFFDEESILIENNSIQIHPLGYAQKIKAGKDFNIERVSAIGYRYGDINNTPFEEKMIKDLPQGCPRIDQLPLF
jgi:hypothetical protein